MPVLRIRGILVDKLGQQVQQSFFGRGDLSLAVGFGGEAYLNLAHARIKSEVDPFWLEASVFEDGDNVGLADAFGADNADEFWARVGIAFLQPGHDFFFENGVEFVGGSRQNKQGFPFRQINPLAGGRADGVGQHYRSIEDKGLPLCGGCHGAPACGIAPGYDVDRRLVENDGLSERFGERVAGNIIDRGAEATTDEDEIGAGKRLFKGASNDWDFIGDGGVAHELKPHSRECFAEVPAMRVQGLPAQQLVADGNEFCLIVHPVLLKVCTHLEVMNKTNQSLSVDTGQRGQRLDAFLAAAVPELSRSHWKVLIQDARVTVNGKACKPNHKLKTGDTVVWSMPEEAPTEVLPENIPIDVLFEDESILVLNKQPGLVVHPAVGNESGTLVNALLYHDAVFQSVERAGIVHRLDKDTSGVMVVAKSEKAMTELQRQFKARETDKEYLALVWGRPPQSGRIVNEIGRHRSHRKKMAVLREGGREAVSNYKTLESFDEMTLVQVKIETGRTHQIRVHMAHLGHPVVGDSVYGRARKHRLPAPPARQMLHAARLEFTHPELGKRLSFEAPLFEDMDLLLKLLREK